MMYSVRFGRLADLLFSVFLFVVGAAVTVYGWRYGVGRFNDVGSGAIPLVLGVLLMVLAILSGREADGEDTGPRRLAPVVFVPLGIAAWALLIDRAGLLLATVALIGFCALAEERLRPVGAVILALALAFAGYGVFVLGFKLPLQMIGG